MKHQGRRARGDAVLRDRWCLAASLSGLVSLAEIKEWDKGPIMWRDAREEEGGRHSCALRMGAAQRQYTVRWSGVNYHLCSSFQGWREE